MFHLPRKWQKYFNIEIRSNRNSFNITLWCVRSVKVHFESMQHHMSWTWRHIQVERRCCEFSKSRMRTLAAQIIRCLITENLYEAWFERKTFQFVKCEKFYSSLSLEVTRTWGASRLWHYHAMEMLAAETEKIVTLFTFAFWLTPFKLTERY